MTSSDLQLLVDKARLHRSSADEKEQQRQSFAYGNTNIENTRITREVVAREAERMKIAGSGE